MLSQETMDFISACEALHQRLAHNGMLTGEEKDLIEFSALDLLNRRETPGLKDFKYGGLENLYHSC